MFNARRFDPARTVAWADMSADLRDRMLVNAYRAGQDDPAADLSGVDDSDPGMAAILGAMRAGQSDARRATA